MNYIIMDLEWNQALNPSKTVREPVLLHGEIIQIGAIKTDDKFNLIDKIKINVRPKYYKKMNPHVAQITGITDMQLTAGETFPQAFRRFRSWCGGSPAGSGSPAGGEQFRFITWGFDDLSMLADNLTLHGLDPSFGSDYINLQLIYNRQLKSEHLQCALSTAAESLEIPLDVQVHDAFNDAYLTYEVCRRLDMTLGLAEYSGYTAAVPQPLFKDAVNDIEDLKKMVSDRRVVELKCPKCGEKLTLRQWLFSNGKSCKTIADCSGCKETFLVKLKACTITEHNYTVLRTIFAANDEDIASYEAKLQKREERRRLAMERKKAEGSNGKNGNV